MLRLVHIFDLRSSGNDEAFLNWLSANLYEKAVEFGCINRKTWLFIDGVNNPYEKKPKSLKRPKFVLEAFWKSQKDADNFRDWLNSDDGSDHRKNWAENVRNHSILRYVEHSSIQNVGDD